MSDETTRKFIEDAQERHRARMERLCSDPEVKARLHRRPLPAPPVEAKSEVGG